MEAKRERPLTTLEALIAIRLDWENDSTLPVGVGPAKRATAAMKRLLQYNEHAYDILCETAEGVTFDVRRYGRTSFCWPRLNGTELGCDPWQGTRFPKAVLCMEVAARIIKAELERRAG